MPERPRVVLLGLDGFPRAAVSPQRTPNLWSLARDGGVAPDGGRASLPTSTYPGFASLLTGALPKEHGVWSTAVNRVPPAWAGDTRVRVPTLFDRCRANGVRCAAIQGDHLLHRVLRTETADLRWPPNASLPPGTPLDLHGYAANTAVRPHVLAAVADVNLGFVFAHLNEVDSLGHERGPEHPDTLAACATTDAIVGEIVDALQPTWQRTLLVVVGDHEMEQRRTDLEVIDPLGEPSLHEVVEDVWPDGGAALIHLRPDLVPEDAAAAIRSVDGVAETTWLAPEVVVAGATPGRLFRAERYSAGGYHGGPATARPLTIVSGGHPAAVELTASIRSHVPHLADWAATVIRVLGLRSGVPHAEAAHA